MTRDEAEKIADALERTAARFAGDGWAWFNDGPAHEVMVKCRQGPKGFEWLLHRQYPRKASRASAVRALRYEVTMSAYIPHNLDVELPL